MQCVSRAGALRALRRPIADAVAMQHATMAALPAAMPAMPARALSISMRAMSAEEASTTEAAFRRPKLRTADLPLHKLHGSTHRLPRVKDTVPAVLTPEEQGTGENFIPTLMRPAEWINPHQPALPTPLPWHSGARRTGLVGTKLGMLQVWDHHGVRLPITVVKIDSQVVGLRQTVGERTRTLGLQIGTGVRKLKHCTKAMLVHFAKAGVAPKRKIVEFAVTPDAVLPVGWRFNVRHFVPGQFVDVTGTSIGKGFQGGMKKWGFGGLNASHGVSVMHRSIGATGSRQDPGKVFKNKKMPGRMGGKRVTKLNNRLFKIDTQHNLLYIVGTLPGHRGQYVVVRDAVQKPWNPATPPPFPTHQPKAGDEAVQEIICAPAEEDPFAFGVA